MILMLAASTTSFHWRGSITWTKTSTSSSPAPRRRRAGRPTDGISEQTQSPRGRLGVRGEFFAGRSAAAVARVFQRDEPLDHLVQPLVIERAAHGRELVAKIFGWRRRDVGLVCALVLPDFNYREVVRPVALLEHVEAHGTCLLAAVRHQGLERRNTLVLFRRRNVHMRHHDDRATAVFCCWRPCDLHARVYPIVDRADEMWLDLVAKFLAVSGGQMCVVGLLVLPDRHDRELVGWGRALQDVETRVALVLAAGIRE